MSVKLKSVKWDSNELIGKLTKQDIILNNLEVEACRELLWNDLCSEYDAENLCLYLKKCGVIFSNDFERFEKIWRRDEFNHYVGFRHIYSILYDEPINEIDKKISAREVSFEPISSLLEDEFKICLLLAYDEIATTKSYSQDYSLYESFGPQQLLTWIKWVARDEAYHFHNCLNIIREVHAPRLPEVSALIDQFISWDLKGDGYKGTFVLDHEGEYFTEDFLKKCKTLIVNNLNANGRKIIL